jgi:outer membrane biosynthesis protein TonB
MIAQAKPQEQKPDDGGMAGALAGSTLVHAVLIALLLAGLPFIATPPRAPMVMAVTLASADVSTATPQEAQTPAPPKPAASERPIPTPPRSTAAAPPQPKPEPPPAPVAPPQAKPAPPPKPQAKPETKPEPAPQKPEDASQDFDALLVNLAPDADPGPRGDTKTPGPAGAPMTAGELAALQRQFKACWNIAAGARYAETLAVEVEIWVGRDRTLRDARIVDSARAARDPAFQAAADAAMRALRHPACTPLDLPPEKYDTWNHIILDFDPSGAL